VLYFFEVTNGGALSLLTAARESKSSQQASAPTGARTFASHGSLSADERRQAEAAFATEPDCAIVATSTLELGIDVGDLALESVSALHRIPSVGGPCGSFQRLFAS
jgi:ATP-dependent helicase YprA (DUF1998 family)